MFSCCGIWKGSKLFPHIKKELYVDTHTKKKTPFMCVWLRYEGCRDCNLRKQIWFYWFAKKKEKKYLSIYSLASLCDVILFGSHITSQNVIWSSFKDVIHWLGWLQWERGSRGRGFTWVTWAGLHVHRAPLSSVKEVKRICIRQTKVSWFKVFFERSERALVNLMAQKSASNKCILMC